METQLDYSDFLLPSVKKSFLRFLYADIEGFGNPVTMFKSQQQSLTTSDPQQNDLSRCVRPDIAIELGIH